VTFVPGVGPRNATVAIVGEAPAKHEVKEGRPFAGPSGKILWPFFGMATGLHRSQVYVTNLWKEMFDERQEKEGLTEEEMAMAAAVLEPELKEMGSLKFIVAMGKHAARHFIADDVRMEQVHGIPVWSEKYNAWILPAFHPAAAMRDGARLAYTVDDLEAFGQLLNGQLRPRPVRPTGQYRRANKTMLRYGLEPRYGPEPGITEIAIDTEFDGGDPLMLTFSAREGQGWLILAEETELLELFRQVLEKWRPVVYGHNWLADLPILKKMGIDLIGMGLKLRDTMAYAWYRQTEPQGLKPLAWRHLGVDVTEFDELVAPYFNESLLAYLYAALAITEPELMERWGKPNKKTGVRKRLKDGRAKASQIHKLVKRFVGDYRKGKVKDVFKRWSKWEEDRISQLEEVVGEPPTFSLRGVPLEIAMKYAGADPDYTLGIAHALPPYSETVAEMDHSRLPMVAEMSERGIWVDLSRRDQLLAELEKDRELKLETLRILTEREDFNPNSPDHIAEVLFGIKKVAPGIREFLQDKEYLIPTGWNKKSGAPKTDKKALGTLRGQGEYDLPAHFLEYKELEKLLNTYVRPMHKYVDSSSILHPNWRHTRVPSGRLAAVRPNIMAIPAKTDRGLRVRWMFRARPGFKLVSFDHSQIELRLAAHVTNDPIMLQAFFDKIDLHTLTAARISKRDINDKEFWGSHAGKLLRALFKQINFGIL
jgi:uracil-DNA glycosylase family 4